MKNELDIDLSFEIMNDRKALDFAKYYDITEIAQSYISHYNEFAKLWICVDVNDYWLCRLAKDVRYDEDEGYIESDGDFVLERNNIAKDAKTDRIWGKQWLFRVLDEDDFSNYDCENVGSVEEAEELLKDFGEDNLGKWEDIFPKKAVK